MKPPLLAVVLGCAILAAGCVGGPAISKKNMGKLEINIQPPEGTAVQNARIFVDNVFIGNVSERMPVLYLKRGSRTVRVELAGTKGFQDTVEILGDPNHQVLNVVLEKE